MPAMPCDSDDSGAEATGGAEWRILRVEETASQGPASGVFAQASRWTEARPWDADSCTVASSAQRRYTIVPSAAWGVNPAKSSRGASVALVKNHPSSTRQLRSFVMTFVAVSREKYISTFRQKITSS